MGEDEVWMFDDRGLGNESRLLIVSLDDASEVASLVWEYKLGVYSQAFGDCDPTPAGNIMGSYWSSKYDVKAGQQLAGIIEVTRETKEVAWHLKVYGPPCAANSTGGVNYGNGTCETNTYHGWEMFSVERFYAAPVLANPGNSSGAPLCAGGELSFTVFDSFKASSIYPGHFKLVEVHTGHVAASGTFHFAAHWRRTVVTADVDLMSRHADSATDVELIVWNTRNKTTSQNMTCTA